MRKNELPETRVAAGTPRALSERRSWHPATQSLIALDPAHWSQRHRQTATWLLVEFLNTQRDLH